MRLAYAAILATTYLSACGETPLAGFGAAGSGPQSAPSEITVTADRVVVRGPTGFCVDPKSSRHGPAQAFIVFGNCAAIADNDELPQPFVNAIATATVLPSGRTGPSIGQSEVALAEFFASDAGKASLSSDGDGGNVEVLDSFARNGAFFVHARENKSQSSPGHATTYWRGYFDVKNSVVALSVLGLKDAPLSSSDGLQTLYDFGNALMEGQAPVTDPTAPKDPNAVTNTGLLRRLFG
ncbi:hypothetical protein [Litoreibacter janthinus]|uniref:Dihydroxy-acid dehydratase n=1 Tax=Litoreibacter janthinus TaxID=670154 RepID=A0A1I6G0I1_9RHOB|nr:hypothetical protein [Litoreibacter janthinus]SFR35650.1 hypothetical protein SAMN04488002_0675 [Litoreibacter janthinus]